MKKCIHEEICKHAHVLIIDKELENFCKHAEFCKHYEAPEEKVEAQIEPTGKKTGKKKRQYNKKKKPEQNIKPKQNIEQTAEVSHVAGDTCNITQKQFRSAKKKISNTRQNKGLNEDQNLALSAMKGKSFEKLSSHQKQQIISIAKDLGWKELRRE